MTKILCTLKTNLSVHKLKSHLWPFLNPAFTLLNKLTIKISIVKHIVTKLYLLFMEEIYRSEIGKDWEDIFSAKKLQSQYVDFRPNKSMAKHYTTALCMYPYSARKVQFSIKQLVWSAASILKPFHFTVGVHLAACTCLCWRIIPWRNWAFDWIWIKQSFWQSMPMKQALPL